MSEWTPEAEEYLDGYLAQVRALVRQSGEEVDEIATELRDHIQREAEASAGSVVSLEHLRNTLAVVGTPEQTASTDSLLMRSSAESLVRRKELTLNPSVAGPEPTPQGIAQTPRPLPEKKSRSGCWAAVVGLFLFALLGVSLWALVVNFQWRQMQKATIYANVKGAVTALQAICAGEIRFLAESQTDSDGDGVPDYGTISQLFKQGLVQQDYSQEAYCNHVFNLRLTPSAESGVPTFVCEAVPIFEEFARTFSVDQTGEVRVEPASGETLQADAEQFLRDREEKSVTNNLRAVLSAEQIFIETVKKDKDGDGVADFGTLEELHFATGVLDSERYILNLTTRNSTSNNGVPGFSCVATPRPSYASAPTYSIDQTGEIRVELNTDPLFKRNSKVESAAPTQP
jgi:hypothetical protein